MQSPHAWCFDSSLEHPYRKVKDGSAGGTSETARGSVFIHPVHQHQAFGVENSCSLGRISEEPAECIGLCPANAECPMLTGTVFLF